MRRLLMAITMLASILLMSGCRLSDQQQIGILKFVASSITAGTADAAPRTVAVKKPCSQHRTQHLHSRMQYAKSRMHRVLSRVMHLEMFAAERKCETRTVIVRRS